MSGKGWLIFSLLLWLAFDDVSEWWYLLAFVGLYLWMTAESDRTGEQPNLRQMIERTLVRKKYSARRRKRRRR